MTNELEKQFFNTFNIEPIGCNDNKNCTGVLDCTQCPNAKYPQITDSHYLELIILVNSPYCEIEYVYTEVKDLKVSILEQAIKCYKNDKLFAKHIQALFKEGEE